MKECEQKYEELKEKILKGGLAKLEFEDALCRLNSNGPSSGLDIDDLFFCYGEMAMAATREEYASLQ